MGHGSIVDSNVLLDLLTEDPVWFPWSCDAIAGAAEEGPLWINPIIYAEVSVRFSNIEDLEQALPAADYGRAQLPRESAFLAGKAFADYRRSGGVKGWTLPYFFIGAHAAVAGLTLITRDATRFKTYFPTIRLIAPSSAD